MPLIVPPQFPGSGGNPERDQEIAAAFADKLERFELSVPISTNKINDARFAFRYISNLLDIVTYTKVHHLDSKLFEHPTIKYITDRLLDETKYLAIRKLSEFLENKDYYDINALSDEEKILLLEVLKLRQDGIGSGNNLFENLFLERLISHLEG